MIRYGSVCSGIEAATVAWHRMGWKPAWFSEIEDFPCAILKHHYQNVPNLGDMTKYKEWPNAKIDLLVGGTPCQSFSVAGLRKGLNDPRGNLMLVYLAMAERFKPKWLVWENVPGVLSSGQGRDFGTFLGALGQLGYGWAYRVLDAQYFGVPQRRRRVFVVGHLGDWRRAAAVLFERHSLSGNPPPLRKTGQEVAGTLNASAAGTSRPAGQANEVSFCILDHPSHRLDAASETLVLDDQGGSVMNVSYGVTGTLRRNTKGHEPTILHPPQVFKVRCGCDGGGKGFLGSEEKSFTVATHQDQNLFQNYRVRRLTPRECERLQGFPDDYTLIPYRGKPTCDGPRYKALGNSMAVSVMRWIGKRIEFSMRREK